MNLTSVNQAQRRAICHKDGPMMVLAGPGSGKTFVITRRILWLLEQGIRPEEILVITFTKASALEMQKRFQALCGDIYAPVTFGTFHAVYFHILKKEFHYSQEQIITEREKRLLLQAVLSEDFPSISGQADTELLLAGIGNAKNEGADPEKFCPAGISGEDFAALFLAYQRAMKENGKIDFEDMVTECARLFQENEEALKRWRAKYHYILIDEFQDINRMQYAVIQKLAYPDNHLFIVGDDDQSIYGFRGSRPDIMLHFPEDYPNAAKVLLAVNYRSTEEIVKTASDFIANNQSRYAKTLSARKGPKCPVLLCAYSSKEQQAEDILQQIGKLREEYAYADMAVITRTNSGAGILMQLMNEHQIPFRYRDKPRSLLSRFYIQDILAFLEFVFDRPLRSRFLRFMNKPVRYLPRNIFPEKEVDLEKIMQQSSCRPALRDTMQRMKRQIDMAQNMDLYGAFWYFMKGWGYESYLRQYAREHGMDEAEIENDIAIIKHNFKAAVNLQHGISLLEEYEKNLMAAADSTEKDAVNLVTMHSSKGLEYQAVFIPDLNEGNMPQAKADTREEVEEERRVLYVAMTRAKERLFLSYVEGNKENRLLKSRFLKQMKYLKTENHLADYSSSSASINSSNS